MTRLDTHERRRLQAELEIAVLQYAIDDRAQDVLDFGVAMFWAAVDAMLAPRPADVLASDFYVTRLRAEERRQACSVPPKD